MKLAGVARGRRKKRTSAADVRLWKRFTRHLWEQFPAVIDHDRPFPLLSVEEAFQACLTASDVFRAGNEDLRVSFYLDHAQVVADVGGYLPDHSDRTAESYARRIRQQVGQRRFALIIQEVQAHHAPLWLRLLKFQRGFEEGSGISGRGAKATLFLGDYEATPFGVHRGNSNVFKFVIAGRKRIRLWPDRFVRAQGVAQHSLEGERLGAAHFSIEGGPGDLLYWPPDFWHVGECLGGLTITISLALFHLRRSIAKDLGECALRSIGTRGDGAERGAVPKGIARVMTRLQRAIDRPDVCEALKVSWLNNASSSGYHAVPPPRPHEALRDDTWVQPQFPIMHVRGDCGEILCSANGHAFAVTAHPGIIKLLARVNEGSRCRVGSLLKRYAGSATVKGITYEATPDDIRVVLEKLCSLRAISTSSRQPVL